jgi:integrase
MIGISSSGWTTTLAAIDRSAHPRDHLRRGTLPGYLRRQDAPCSQPDRGDLEQYHPVLYAMVDYLDLYILGSYGPGRGAAPGAEPVRLVLLRRRPLPHLLAFEPDEARAFLAAARESALAPLYTTGFLTGLRLGELCGLYLDDDRMVIVRGQHVRQLRVERQLGQDQRSLRDPQPTGPKSKLSRRHVNVGHDLGVLFDSIKSDRRRLAVERGWRPVPNWMFVTTNGTPYSERNVEREFQRVLRQAGLANRGLSPNAMRHTFAVTHVLDGCNPKWLQQQMGHSSIKITLDTYGKWFDLQDHAQADKIGARLLGGDTGGDRRA